MDASFHRLASAQTKAEQKTEARLDLMDARFEQTDERIDGLSKQLTGGFDTLVEYERLATKKLDARFANVDTRFNEVNARFEKVDARFEKFDARLEALAQDMAASFQQVVEYQLRTEQQIDDRFKAVDARFDRLEATMATKDDIANMATKDDIANMATKDDIANMATKDDIANMATKDDIANMATKDDIANMATKDDLARMEVRILGAIKQLFMAAGMSFSLPTADITTYRQP